MNIIDSFIIDGVELLVSCDIKGIAKEIESLKGRYYNSQYGYESTLYPYNTLTESEYVENIDLLYEEFEKRIDTKYLHRIVSLALKKLDGSFHKNRVYDEYDCLHGSSNGMGCLDVISVRFKVVSSNTIKLYLFSNQIVKDPNPFNR